MSSIFLVRVELNDPIKFVTRFWYLGMKLIKTNYLVITYSTTQKDFLTYLFSQSLLYHVLGRSNESHKKHKIIKWKVTFHYLVFEMVPDLWNDVIL